MINRQYKKIDILLKTSNGKETLHIPINLKCYRQPTRSGGKSGAYDIFKKEVYAGLALLEQYTTLSHFAQGYELISKSCFLVHQVDHRVAMYITPYIFGKYRLCSFRGILRSP